MLDRFDRKINYLRISVTDRCNLRCRYCMPEEGIHLIRHEDIVTFEEIFEFTEIAVDYGITKVRLTGGEPLVRKNVVSLVMMLSGIDGIEDISMTTNGILLSRYAQELKSAGLSRLNVSIDTMDPCRFEHITRGGNLSDVFEGLKTAGEAGFDSIKINTVIEESSSEREAMKVAEFAKKNGYPIRYIRKMDLKTGQFWIVDGGTGGDCIQCNRLRLTSDGYVKPCLFSGIGFNIRKLGYKEALMKAVEFKPEKGKVNENGTFYAIGG